MLDPVFFLGVAVGFIVGALLTAALSFPRVARGLGKLAAIVFICCGVGLLVWGLISAFNREAFESLRFGLVTFYSPAQILGWGAGLLAGGITALVLSFVGKQKG